jgi:pyruvate/2-oxoglutarate dehydrogenase complex dihydrolipoamide dehydrogenase (E3) component
MADLLDPDLCVIGAGPAGIAVAEAARALDASVVLVEAGEPGGASLYSASVPARAAAAAARLSQNIREGSRLGVETGEPRVNFSRLHDHLSGVVSEIAVSDSFARLEAIGVNVMRGIGRFVDARTLEVDGIPVRARRFVVATGSIPSVPSIEGLNDIDYLTSDTIFELTSRPGHLVVIGGGPTGVELAQTYRRLGCEVTLFQSANVLPREDPEFVEILLRRLAEEGVTVHSGASVGAVQKKGGSISVFANGGQGEIEISGSHVLVATGRQPNVDALNLEAAGVKLFADRIAAGADLRTANPRIFAVGDLAGDAHFAHTGKYHARLVAENVLSGARRRIDPFLIPRVTFSDPELAQIGPTEWEARRHYRGGFEVLRTDFSGNDRARAERLGEGLIKVIVDSRGRLIGAGAVGPQAGDLIGFFAFAIANRLGLNAFGQTILPYPSLNEIAADLARSRPPSGRLSALEKGRRALNRLFR